LVPSYFVPLFGNPELVDDYVRLFYPLVFAMGCQQNNSQKNLQPKKGKRRCEAAFFKDTSNYAVCST
jgi:hypothetical protein